MAFVDDLLWVTLLALIKLSILHLYTTIFKNATFIKATRCVVALCIAAWTGSLLIRILICLPVAKNWDQTVTEATHGTCGNISTMYIAIASVDLFIDLIIIALPMPVLWGLQMPQAKRLAVMGIFALGFM